MYYFHIYICKLVHVHGSLFLLYYVFNFDYCLFEQKYYGRLHSSSALEVMVGRKVKGKSGEKLGPTRRIDSLQKGRKQFYIHPMRLASRPSARRRELPGNRKWEVGALTDLKRGRKRSMPMRVTYKTPLPIIQRHNLYL